MKTIKPKTLIIVIIIAVAIYAVAESIISLHTSVTIDTEYLADRNDKISEVLYVEKLTDNESVAVALSKSKNNGLTVCSLVDGLSRYSHLTSMSFDSPAFLTEVGSHTIIKRSKFGDVYYCLFQNPISDTVEVNGIDRPVYAFKYTLQGEEYNLGFYCGLIEND